MKKPSFLVILWHSFKHALLGLAVGIAIILFNVCNAKAQGYFAKATRVKDGDTFVAMDSAGTIRNIRLWAIDAPEQGQDFYSEATNYLASMVENKTVYIISAGTDFYGRELAVVYYEHPDRVGYVASINAQMTFAGYAFFYPDYLTKDEKYSEDAEDIKSGEGFAESINQGVWSIEGYQKPWLYRREQKKLKTQKKK